MDEKRAPPEPSGSNWILDTWNKEWPVIKSAPFSFGICVLIVTAFAVFAVCSYEERHYSETINAKSATIEAKEAFIQTLLSGKDAEELFKNLPTSDPHIKGKPWSNGGVLEVSDGH